jgi:hypothetical protein
MTRVSNAVSDAALLQDVGSIVRLNRLGPSSNRGDRRFAQVLTAQHAINDGNTTIHAGLEYSLRTRASL